MARLIDVEPIIARYSGGESMKSMAECIHDEIFVSVLKNAPVVDAVEVVRCKDCKYYEHPEYYDGGTKDVCRTFKRQMQEADFCSYGERKAENNGRLV